MSATTVRAAIARMRIVMQASTTTAYAVAPGGRVCAIHSSASVAIAEYANVNAHIPGPKWSRLYVGRNRSWITAIRAAKPASPYANWSASPPVMAQYATPAMAGGADSIARVG